LKPGIQFDTHYRNGHSKTQTENLRLC